MSNSTSPGRSWHDMGGKDAGPAPSPEHDYALWEKRIDALMVIAFKNGLFTVDAMRRALEGLGEDAFETMTYYERWTAALAQNLVEQGTVTLPELNARMAEVADRGATYGAAQEPKP